jgi:hypothetical protein
MRTVIIINKKILRNRINSNQSCNSATFNKILAKLNPHYKIMRNYKVFP